jgi:putative protease
VRKKQTAAPSKKTARKTSRKKAARSTPKSKAKRTTTRKAPRKKSARKKAPSGPRAARAPKQSRPKTGLRTTSVQPPLPRPQTVADGPTRPLDTAVVPAQKAAAGSVAPVEKSVAASDATPIGVVTHYYPRANAAAVAVGPGGLRTGDTVHFRGHTTDFYQKLDRLEIDHQPVVVAKSGQVIGVHVAQRVREGDVLRRVD